MSNTFPNFLLKSDITVRHSVVSLPTDSALHWQVKRFRAKKFLVRASSSMNMTLAFAVSIIFLVWRDRELVYRRAVHERRITHIRRTAFISRCHDECFA